MANEAVLVMEQSLSENFTCADGVGIEQGAICKLTSPNTASLSDGDNDIVAGIVQTEKIADRGGPSVSIYRDGLFRVTCSGSISAGSPVVTGAVSGGTNYVALATANQENILGVMREDATDGQSKLMELKPTTMKLA